MTGDECPVPTVLSQTLRGLSGQVAGAVNAAVTPEREGPRHWFQSCARGAATQAAAKAMTKTMGWRMAIVDPLSLILDPESLSRIPIPDP